MKRRIEERKTLAATPTLGKGFSVGQEISLDVPVKKSKSTVSAQLAKVSDESTNLLLALLLLYRTDELCKIKTYQLNLWTEFNQNF